MVSIGGLDNIHPPMPKPLCLLQLIEQLHLPKRNGLVYDMYAVFNKFKKTLIGAKNFYIDIVMIICWYIHAHGIAPI
jgi:hypothetical protein